jgi:hypothetical protein
MNDKFEIELMNGDLVLLLTKENAILYMNSMDKLVFCSDISGLSVDNPKILLLENELENLFNNINQNKLNYKLELWDSITGIYYYHIVDSDISLDITTKQAYDAYPLSTDITNIHYTREKIS